MTDRGHREVSREEGVQMARRLGCFSFWEISPDEEHRACSKVMFSLAQCMSALACICNELSTGRYSCQRRETDSSEMVQLDTLL